jgi:hypothetical protein
MGARPGDFNLLHPGNRKANLCYAHLQGTSNKTNVRFGFSACRRVGPGLILALFEGQRTALGSPAVRPWLWNGGLDVVFSKVSQ